MKAIIMDRHGGLDVLRYGELPDPVAEAGQVVVDIHAASVNGADTKVREGGAYATISKFPYVLGRDFSGVVASLGRRRHRIQGRRRRVRRAGGWARWRLRGEGRGEGGDPLSQARKPLPRRGRRPRAHGLTALVSIEDTIKLKRGETILIQGGAGGVAGYAIQLAKHIGARVITTASAANHAYVKSLGADQVIDYNKEDFTQVVKDVDAVFETVGGDVAMRSFAVVKSGGRAAFIASGATAPSRRVRTSVAAPGGRPRPSPPRAHPASACDRCRARAGDAVCFRCARPSRRSASVRPPLPRQADIEGAIAVVRRAKQRGRWPSATCSSLWLASSSWSEPTP